MLLALFAILVILLALWLLAFAAGQGMMLLFPACPGERVLYPNFRLRGRKPILLLAGIAAVLGVPLLLCGLSLWSCA